MTTRICHSKGIVILNDRQEAGIKKYYKNIQENIPVPAFVKNMRARVEERSGKLQRYSDETSLNFIERCQSDIGVIASGAAFYYAKEVFGDTVSYLKLGFTYPLPVNRILEFAKGLKEIYIIEENDSYIEEHIRSLGIGCHGKDMFPYTGEMTPDVIRKSFFGKTMDTLQYNKDSLVSRPPTLCAGCPHRGFLLELGKRKNLLMSGDIGCYSLSFMEPYNAMDLSLCMGAGFSMGHGAQQVFNRKDSPEKKRVVSFMGDSTFFHTGINSLINVGYNQSNTINVILDNRITGMTGHQQNPGTGYTLQGNQTKEISIERIVEACGFENIKVIDPNNLKEVKDALDWALSLEGPSVIITRWPCVLKKLTVADKDEFNGVFLNKCTVLENTCTGCKVCIRIGCPAISFDKEKKKASISASSCVGCEVCKQVCAFEAIVKEEKYDE